jgi:hypothetical protein
LLPVEYHHVGDRIRRRQLGHFLRHNGSATFGGKKGKATVATRAGFITSTVAPQGAADVDGHG